MGIVARLARSTSPNDPLREELRKAIEAHEQAKKERDRLASILEQSQRRCWDFFDEIDKLAAEVTTLVDTRSERVAARVLDGKDLIDHELKDAQRRLADTEEAQSVAQAAHGVLEMTFENSESVLASSEARLKQAAAAILLTTVGEVEDRIRSLMNELSPLFAQLTYLQHLNVATGWNTDDHRRRERLLSDPLRAMPCYGKTLSDPAVVPVIEPLKRALNALMADASASVQEL